jgi:hypothetical protein
MNIRNFLSCISIFIIIPATATRASETVSYSYDAKGRLIRVVHTGTINNNVQTTYSHDKADNRKNTTTTGSPNN